MDIAIIKTGRAPNDGTGDTTRDAWAKQNANNAAFQTGVDGAKASAAASADMASAAASKADQALADIGTRVRMQGKRVRDADYSALATDTYVGLYDLTASRRVFLPLSSDFPLSQPFYVADESGVCSQAIAITVVASGADTIAGQTTVTMIVPYQKLVFHSNGAGLWTFA